MIIAMVIVVVLFIAAGVFTIIVWREKYSFVWGWPPWRERKRIWPEDINNIGYDVELMELGDVEMMFGRIVTTPLLNS